MVYNKIIKLRILMEPVMILYHGTNLEGKEQIVKNGFFTDLVFLTPSESSAEEYGCEIIIVEVDEDDLMIDFDLPGSIGVCVETANQITGQSNWTITDYINNDYNLCVKKELIKIRG